MAAYEETGLLVVLITDLETNTPSMVKAMKIANSMKHRIVLVSPFSWLYHVEGSGLSPDLLERIYQDLEEKQSVIKAIRASGVRVIEIDSRERGDKVIVCQNGVFGGRMKENVERCGATAIMVEDTWGEPVNVDKVISGLRRLSR